MTSTLPVVVAGVDTHTDTHHVAVVSTTGAPLADAQFPTTWSGHRDLLRFVTAQGRIQVVGVEGTGSYGAGLTRYLRQAGVPVAEVTRPARHVRRLHGKSDPIDAYAAAATVLAGDRCPTPKVTSGDVEAIRALHLVRRSAIRPAATPSGRSSRCWSPHPNTCAPSCVS